MTEKKNDSGFGFDFDTTPAAAETPEKAAEAQPFGDAPLLSAERSEELAQWERELREEREKAKREEHPEKRAPKRAEPAEKKSAEKTESEAEPAQEDVDPLRSARERRKRDPEARVAYLNGIFDRLLLPMLIFTVLVILGAVFIPKIASCDPGGSRTESAADAPADVRPAFDLYTARSRMYLDMSAAQAKLEAVGYLVMDDGTGNIVAYKQLDDGLEILEHVKDTEGTPYTALTETTGEGETAAETTLMVYTRNVMLAIVKRGEETRSAVFTDGFAPDASDSDCGALLEWCEAEKLESMLARYEADMTAALDA